MLITGPKVHNVKKHLKVYKLGNLGDVGEMGGMSFLRRVEL
jgi:hypothetical protein